MKVVWKKEIDELKRRGKLAKEMGGAEAVARQHSKGRLTVRERIDVFLDRDTFKEIGTLAGRAEYDGNGKLKSFTHMPRVTGYGKINDRLVCVEGADFTIRGGWADPTSFASIGGLRNHN